MRNRYSDYLSFGHLMFTMFVCGFITSDAIRNPSWSEGTLVVALLVTGILQNIASVDEMTARLFAFCAEFCANREEKLRQTLAVTDKTD